MSEARGPRVWAFVLVGLVSAVLLVLLVRPEKRLAPDPSGIDAGPASPADRAQVPRRSARDSSPARVVRSRDQDWGEDEGAGPAAVVAGHVVDPNSGPLGEGRVDLVCASGQTRARARLDDEGAFAGPACAEGPTCARLVHPVFEQSVAWVLVPDTLEELSVEQGPSVQGNVVSGRGEPVANARVVVRAGDRHSMTTTDLAGEFAVSLPRLRPCDLCDMGQSARDCDAEEDREVQEHAQLWVETTDMSAIEVDAEVRGFASFEVLERGQGRLEGRVVDGRGQAFPSRVTVIATRANVEALERHAAVVAADGSFELVGLAGQGRYDLRALRDGRELARVAGVAAGDEVVLEASEGGPLVDLVVELRDHGGGPAADVRVDGGPFRGRVSDARGRVEASAVVPGHYDLRLRPPGCALVRWSVSVESVELAESVEDTAEGAGRAVKLDLELPDGCG